MGLFGGCSRELGSISTDLPTQACVVARFGLCFLLGNVHQSRSFAVLNTESLIRPLTWEPQQSSILSCRKQDRNWMPWRILVQPLASLAYLAAFRMRGGRGELASSFLIQQPLARLLKDTRPCQKDEWRPASNSKFWFFFDERWKSTVRVSGLIKKSTCFR